MRKATIERVTSETTITIELSLDELEPICEINTGIGFLDHMLILFARHARIALSVQADGDLYVDGHHTTEDVGIVIGQCLKLALGDKSGINRYGNEYVPMDETLGFAAIDLSGRSYLVFNAGFETSKVGDFDTELVEEFFQAVAFNAELTLHLSIMYGRNTHHKIESLFKAFGRALRQAIDLNPAIKGVNSTKGVL